VTLPTQVSAGQSKLDLLVREFAQWGETSAAVHFHNTAAPTTTPKPSKGKVLKQKRTESHAPGKEPSTVPLALNVTGYGETFVAASLALARAQSLRGAGSESITATVDKALQCAAALEVQLQCEATLEVQHEHQQASSDTSTLTYNTSASTADSSLTKVGGKRGSGKMNDQRIASNKLFRGHKLREAKIQLMQLKTRACAGVGWNKRALVRAMQARLFFFSGGGTTDHSHIKAAAGGGAVANARGAGKKKQSPAAGNGGGGGSGGGGGGGGTNGAGTKVHPSTAQQTNRALIAAALLRGVQSFGGTPALFAAARKGRATGVGAGVGTDSVVGAGAGVGVDKKEAPAAGPATGSNHYDLLLDCRGFIQFEEVFPRRRMLPAALPPLHVELGSGSG
jgi:hypothetical protein